MSKCGLENSGRGFRMLEAQLVLQLVDDVLLWQKTETCSVFLSTKGSFFTKELMYDIREL